MANIPEVQNSTAISTAEFVKLTIFNEYGNTANTTIHTFSSSYKEETIDGIVYDPLGGLLAVGSQKRDIRVTSGDTTISLSGVDGNNIYTVLSTKIRGSEIEVIRGFYDNNYVLQNTYPRFTGIVTNYNIAEDLDNDNNFDTFTVSIAASSYKTILENRIAGRKTNEESWKFFNPTDTSMDQVYAISGVQFDFGQKPQPTTVVPGRGGGGGAPGTEPEGEQFQP
jgi:hypothetical protein